MTTHKDEFGEWEDEEQNTKQEMEAVEDEFGNIDYVPKNMIPWGAPVDENGYMTWDEFIEYTEGMTIDQKDLLFGAWSSEELQEYEDKLNEYRHEPGTI